MQAKQGRFGLFTAITMIVGICIGSGIFFKSDNILVATGGSTLLGVVVFVLGAMAIIFGGLCMSQLAARTDKAGGVISYFEMFAGKKMACAFGWFQLFVYYPAITAVVSWVVGIYTDVLFNLGLTFSQQILVGMAFSVICLVYNILSPKFGGIFQNATTIIKLLPLVVMGVLGIFLGDPLAGLANQAAGGASSVAGLGWIAAVGPIAFSYDGWIISTSIAHEVKNTKRNMPIALIVAPLFVLVIYVLYFVGVTSLIGAEQVMALGDNHVAVAASKLLGDFGAKAIIVFVVISIMGTVNGLMMGIIRLPYLIALRGDVVPFAKSLRKVNERFGLSLGSAAMGFGLFLVWTLIHYFTLGKPFLPNSDVSEVPITLSYLMYIVLYVQVLRLYKKGQIKSVWMGVVVPVLAMLGSGFILWGGMHDVGLVGYAIVCLVPTAIAFIYLGKDKEANPPKSMSL